MSNKVEATPHKENKGSKESKEPKYPNLGLDFQTLPDDATQALTPSGSPDTGLTQDGAEAKNQHSQLMPKDLETPLPRTHVLNIDPKKIRIRDDHDRNYALLNKDNCDDLIDSMDKHGQLIPAVVVKSSDPNFAWDLVYGARRHWVADFLSRPLIAEPRELSEEEIFILSDQENRARKDISDYERGLKYYNAIYVSKLFKSTAALSQRLALSKTLIHYMVQLGKAPAAFLDAIIDINDVKERKYRELASLMLDDEGELTERAENLFTFHVNSKITINEMIHILSSDKKSEDANVAYKQVFHGHRHGKVILTVQNNPGRSSFQFTIPKKTFTDSTSNEELITIIERVLTTLKENEHEAPTLTDHDL